MNCPNCNGTNLVCKKRVAVTKENIKSDLMHCNDCDMLFLLNPTWLINAYKESFSCDTGHVIRNNYLASKSILYFRIWQIISRTAAFEKCLDLGTGIGIFPRLMRDKGYLFYGFDEFSTMSLIKPFIVPDEMISKIKIKTSFEVIEHIPSLPTFLREKVGDVNLFLFTTKLRDVGQIPNSNWDYYNFEVGQHISFHSIKSLKIAFQKEGYDPGRIFSYGKSLHVFAKTRKWIIAFQLARIIWKINLLFEKLQKIVLSLIFKEKSLTQSDFIYSRNLIKNKR